MRKTSLVLLLACAVLSSSGGSAWAAQYFSPTAFTQNDPSGNLKGIWYTEKSRACTGPWMQIFSYFTPKQIKSRQDNQPCGLNNGVTITVIDTDARPTPYPHALNGRVGAPAPRADHARVLASLASFPAR